MPFPGLLPAWNAVAAGPPLTNLVIWLKTPIAGLVDNDSVNTWPDSSGAGNDFGAVTAPIYKTTSVTINGLPTVQFNGSTHAVLCDTFDSSGYSSASIFIVGRQDADPPTVGWGFWIWNPADGLPSAVPYTDGVIYDRAFTTVRKTVGNPTPSMASAFQYNVISASASYKARLNGAEIFSTGTNTYQGQDTSHGSNNAMIGSSGTATSQYAGVFSELLVYSTALDDATRDLVEAYLATRFGL